MYDKIDIKLTAHLLPVVLANGYGNETIGRGHHDGVDDAYEGDDAGNDRIESVVAYTQCLQTETRIEQSANGYNSESDVKYERVYRYRFVCIFLHSQVIIVHTLILPSKYTYPHHHKHNANNKAMREGIA